MREKRRDVLGERLRKEGLGAVSGFSPELHGRVMEALRAKGLEMPGGEEDAGGRWRIAGRVGGLLAAAAAVGVVVWIVLRPGPPARVERPQVVEVPSVMPEVIEPMRARMARPAAWEEARYGYLDKDARRLMVFVASQIPGVPGEGEAR